MGSRGQASGRRRIGHPGSLLATAGLEAIFGPCRLNRAWVFAPFGSAHRGDNALTMPDFKAITPMASPGPSQAPLQGA